MEYAVQAWAPWPRKDIDLLQRIYHRVSKMVVGFEKLPFEERMRKFNLFDFNKRRIRGDLILIFKILKSDDHPLKCMFHVRSSRELRSNNYAVEVPTSRVNCRRYFFSVRVCFVWNALPHKVINCRSLCEFKNALDLYMQCNNVLDNKY